MLHSCTFFSTWKHRYVRIYIKSWVEGQIQHQWLGETQIYLGQNLMKFNAILCKWSINEHKLLQLSYKHNMLMLVPLFITILQSTWFKGGGGWGGSVLFWPHTPPRSCSGLIVLTVSLQKVIYLSQWVRQRSAYMFKHPILNHLPTLLHWKWTWKIWGTHQSKF